MTRTLDNIVLVGFASTGKSVTGRGLADTLGMAFVDLDDIVERLHLTERGQRRRCRQIMDLLGRECFIGYESTALDALTPSTGQVIATGGGTPMDRVNRQKTRALGRVVYLKASPEVIFGRMAKKGFPHYLGPNATLDALEVIWRGRDPIYAETADVTVDNSGLTPEQSVRAIIDRLGPS